MKAHLLYADRDFRPGAALPSHAADLTADLGLDALFDAMAAGDELLREVAVAGVLGSSEDGDAEVRYRQDALRDALARPEAVRKIYTLASEALERERHLYGWAFRLNPDAILHRSMQVLAMQLDLLEQLRRIADAHVDEAGSDAFRQLFALLRSELSDAFLATARRHLALLEFKAGMLVSARLGSGNVGTDYVLRRAHTDPRPRWRRLLPGERTSLSMRIDDRDEAGHRTLRELKGRGVNHVANAVAQSAEHVTAFFHSLQAEVGFYVGCLNLHQQLTDLDAPVCFPDLTQPGSPTLSCRGLYDPCLSLAAGSRAVGNDVAADGRPLIVVTGANRGGKSTFLRSIGTAQLMLQAGMFVAAAEFSASPAIGTFTHFAREEDDSMTHGKLDEELSRMSRLADVLAPGSLVLFNESFSSTNEREGSEIARQVVRALVDAGVRVCYVTHLYDLAESLYAARGDDPLFLRAERLPDGTRTFRMVEGEPEPTSYGEDIYQLVFGVNPSPDG